MAVPNTRRGLEAEGYTYSGEGTCRGCGCVLLWFDTPRGKKMPMEIVEGTEDDAERTLACHFERCPQGNEFRKKDKK